MFVEDTSVYGMQAEDAPLTPTTGVEMLSYCARTDGNEHAARRLVCDMQDEQVWHDFVRLAGLHGVRPLVYRFLERTCPGLVPEEARLTLRQSFYSAAAYNVTLAKELHRVKMLLEEAGVPLLPFKGPLLAQFAYGSLGLRPCTDLDFLVPPEAFPAVEAALLSGGYLVTPSKRDLRGVEKALHLYLARQLPFVLQEGAVGLDVHTGVMPPGYRSIGSFDELMQRSIVVTVNGLPFPSLSPEDLLLILCLHGIKNRWETLKYYCDVAELIRAQRGIDWDVVVSRARASRIERALLLGLYLAHHVLDAPIPPALERTSYSDAQVRRLGEQVIRGMQTISVARLPRGERIRFHVGVQESMGTKVRYCAYALLRQVYDTVSRSRLD